jgi:hypothetical protein
MTQVSKEETIKVGDKVFVANRSIRPMADYPYSGTVKEVFLQAGFVPCAIIETGDKVRPERIFDNDINTISLLKEN